MRRTRGLYRPGSEKPFKLSRSKIDLFWQCPRCFYIDRRLGISRPSIPSFTLNSAVDTLLKQEFDIHRAQGSKHPLLERYGVDARPVPHEQLAQWRENFQGVQFLHKPTNFLIFGAIDDLWQEPDGNHIVVDYKATAKRDAVTELTTRWHEGYKRQMEVYQWLLRRNDLSVSDTGYFVYCNGRADREAFDGKLEFDVTLIAHTGNDEWVEPIIHDIHTCLNSDTVPAFGEECEHCAFVEDALHLST